MADEKPAETSQVAVIPHAVNGLAVASMIVGIVAFVSGWIPFWGLLAGGAAVVLGIVGLKKPNGKGMSITGIVTGGIALLTSILFTVVFFFALTGGSSYFSEANTEYTEDSMNAQQMIDSKKVFKKGEVATFGPYEVKVNSVQPDFTPKDTSETPLEGYKYIVVNATVTLKGEDSGYIGPYTFFLTANGDIIDSSYVTEDPELSASNLKPNQSLTGNLVFEVPKDAQSLKLQYVTTVYDARYEPVELTYSLEI